MNECVFDEKRAIVWNVKADERAEIERRRKGTDTGDGTFLSRVQRQSAETIASFVPRGEVGRMKEPQ